MTTKADVFVVSLTDERLEPGHRLTFLDVPFTLKKYFYPVAPPWPRRIPAGFIGFRFGGHLQAIARIVGQRTIPNFDTEIAGLTVSWASTPHVVLDLDELEKWPRPLRSGNIRAQHLYCDLDCLHSSETVQEAADKTRDKHR